MDYCQYLSASPRWRGAILLPALLAVTALLPHVASADIYKYVDARGVTVYTDKPATTNHTKMVMSPKGWVDPTKSSVYMSKYKVNVRHYKRYVDQAAVDYDLPQPLIHAVITAESAYNPWAVSSAGAMGLMQLMPDTAKRYGVTDAFNARQNIRGGCQYLKDLMARFNGNLSLVLAAYNAGEGAVEKYNNTIPPYQETRNYVRKVRQLYAQSVQELALND